MAPVQFGPLKGTMNCHIEIFMDGRWMTAAVFEPENRTLDLGIGGGGWLQYDIDYAVAHLGEREAELIPGLNVGFELFSYKEWPPVLVDLLPGGAGRRAWLKRMQIEKDGPQMDWHLLVKGAGPLRAISGLPKRFHHPRPVTSDWISPRGHHRSGRTIPGLRGRARCLCGRGFQRTGGSPQIPSRRSS